MSRVFSLIAAFCLLTPSLAQANDVTKRLLPLAAAADVITTEVALRRGAEEHNPLMKGGTGQRIAVQAASVAATLWLAQKLERKYPALVKYGLRSMVFTYGALAVNNTAVALSQSQSPPRRLRYR